MTVEYGNERWSTGMTVEYGNERWSTGMTVWSMTVECGND